MNSQHWGHSDLELDPEVEFLTYFFILLTIPVLNMKLIHQRTPIIEDTLLGIFFFVLSLFLL